MENQENQTENIQDNKERAYATGKRKNSIARVWLKSCLLYTSPSPRD